MNAVTDRTPVIGKVYSVPCIKTTKDCRYGRGGYMPVIGPEHTDKEFINFPSEHYHVDWRFASALAFRKATWVRMPEGEHSHAYAAVLQRWGYGDPSYGMELTKGGVVMRRMRCKREWPAYPYSVKWMEKLEDAYACHKLKPGLICPHKGLPLETCPTNNDVVTCPGHGLRWNVKTGELVRS